MEGNNIIIVPETIYHYCTIATLNSIIASKSIWLNDPRKMNDSEELIWATKKMDSIFKKEILTSWEDSFLTNQKISLLTKLKENSPHDIEKEKLILSNYDRMIKMSVEDRNLEKNRLLKQLNTRLHEDLKKKIETNTPKGSRFIYISCFSKEADKLSQWRGYGDDGRGVSIGFKKSSLCNTNCLLNNVVYEDAHQEMIMTLGIDLYQINQENIDSLLYYLIPCFKPVGFSEEEEVRLIYTPSKNGDLKRDLHLSGSEIRDHYSFPLPPDCISEIILGPKCGIPLRDIVLYLDSHGFIINDEQVRKSGLSYR